MEEGLGKAGGYGHVVRHRLPEFWAREMSRSCDPRLLVLLALLLIAAVALYASLGCGLALGPVHLVAHSLGAYAALDLACSSPGQVRSLVLSEPPVMPWLTREPATVPLLDEHISLLWEPVRRAFAETMARSPVVPLE